MTSFANAGGGDLIFGIEEDTTTREPRSLTGLKVESIDNQKTRLDNIIRTGVEPRLLNVIIRPVSLSNSRYALLLRIPRSWTSPHRVVFGGHAKFYSRNSSGKYEMDVDELRIAFNLAETIIEKVRNFRADRISKVLADETPVLLNSPHRVVLHFVHGNAFNPSIKFDVNSIYEQRHEKLPIINETTNNGRYNLDGLFTYSIPVDGKYRGYTQLYRNGIIEAVDAWMLREREDHGKIIPGIAFEKKLIQATSRYLNLMSELGVEPPIFIFLSLLNVKDYKIATTNGGFPEYTDVIDRDMLLLPAEVVEDHGIRDKTVMKPIFDLIWNACGCPRSVNFDENGNWNPKR